MGARFPTAVSGCAVESAGKNAGESAVRSTTRSAADGADTADCALQVEELCVSFGAARSKIAALDRLSFRLRRGEIGCLLGASGCGKTTALRTIAGFLRPESGCVHIDAQCVASPQQWTEPERRGVGVVFQDYALFPHLDVAGNVGFGLRRHTAAQRAQRVREMLELVGLPGSGARFPHELSGGQQQRVALARALAPAPSILLLDEPFSNLDPDLRERLALDLREILKRAGTTALLVTHDQYEAFALADRVGVMQAGRIEQWDTPYRLYHQPATREVADFVGLGAFLPGVVEHRDGRSQVQIELGTLPIHARTDQAIAGAAANTRGEVLVLLRPDDVVHDDASTLRAQVVRKAFRGAQFLYTLRLPSGATLLALVPSHHDHAIGESIGIRFDADHVVTFDVQETARTAH
ncbi:MAG: ABC transporter ATP-binding protein [Burkholderiales bacterium]|nr:MAG: ABC transporter ATP-binding protein [Burkholderiales bacterium]